MRTSLSVSPILSRLFDVQVGLTMDRDVPGPSLTRHYGDANALLKLDVSRSAVSPALR